MAAFLQTFFLYFGLGIIGIYSGYPLGGLAGAAIGGGLGSALAVLIEDQRKKHPIEGFWLRNRYELAGILGAAVGLFLFTERFGNNWFAFMASWIIGGLLGRGLAKKLGWDVAPLSMDHRLALAQVHLLLCAARIDGGASPKRQERVMQASKVILERYGYTTPEQLLEVHKQLPPAEPEEAGEYFRSLEGDLKMHTLLELLAILYCDSGAEEQRNTWLERFGPATGLEKVEWYFYLMFFDRKLVQGETSEQRVAWLAELGLSGQPNDEEIRAAYRTKASEYHPDRHQGLAPHIRELAAAKMATVSSAYANLRNELSEAGAQSVVFLAAGCSTILTPAENEAFECCCRMCNTRCRVPAEAVHASARCGKCCVLLGMSIGAAESVVASATASAA